MGLEGAGRGLTNPSRGWEVFDELLGLTAHEAGLEVDVVSVSLKPTCVTQRSVAALNKHLRPRNINIITGSEEQCRLFSRHGKNVRCWREDRVVPGLTKDAVAAAIDGRFGEGLGDGEFNGRQLAGWYFQQVME